MLFNVPLHANNQIHQEMKIQKPQYEIWEQIAGEAGIYKQIERAGRVCYKSEDHTTDDLPDHSSSE